MNDEPYMRLAIEEAKSAARRGEVPVGAVLVNAAGDHHKPEVTGGILSEACAELLKSFFRARRK